MAIDSKTRETLILVAVFGVLTIGIMCIRLFMRKYRQQRFIASDYITMVCILFILGRSAFTTVVLLWGNNNTTQPLADLTAQEIYRREVGSKLTLVNRAVYNTYIWLQKGCVLLLCERVLLGLQYSEVIVKAYWAVLVASLTAVQITTFSECSPFHLYWQVVPAPGICKNANVQLVTLVALNVSTDGMLILLPMPWLIRLRRSWTQRLQLMALFSLGFLLIAISIVRLPGFVNGTSQVNRNTWGSVEQFFAAVVANVPTLFSLRRKKTEESYPSHSTPITPRRRTRSGFRQFRDEILVTNTVDLEYDMVDVTHSDKDSKNTESTHIGQAQTQ